MCVIILYLSNSISLIQLQTNCPSLLHVFIPRAISVLLGERWKKMRSEERRVFTVQAKALADEQKRINPDCWKRKRTNSVGAANVD